MIVRRRLAALLEVLGVYAAGLLVTGLLNRALRVRIPNPLADFTASISDAQLITASLQFLGILALQNAGWFLLIIPINWWHRRRGPAAYGLKRAGHSWRALLLAGLATAALSEWPVLSLSLVDTFHDLGETAAWRQAFFDTSWRRWEFWLFSGVISWGIVPVLEELFFRGYCQRRLAEDWGDGAAIVGTSCLFVFAHGQYLILNAYSVGMIVSLLCIAIGFGLVFAWTRSLIPSIIAHAIINIPMTPLWQGICLAAFLVGAVVAAPRGLRVMKQVFPTSTLAACLGLAVVGASWAVVAGRVEHADLLGAAMVLLAIGFYVVERRRVAGGGHEPQPPAGTVAHEPKVTRPRS